MSNVTKLTYDEIINYVGNICGDLDDDEVNVDMVVCLCPSSMSLGQMFGNYLDVPVQGVSWQLDGENNETNCWLPEEALDGTQLLIVTETNDDKLISSLIEDWSSSVCGKTEWLDNVIFCSLVSNKKSKFVVDYYGLEHNGKDAISMPWDDWWK